MKALRILSAVLGCSLLVLACSGGSEAADDDDDDGGSGGSSASGGSGGSGASGGSSASGGTGGSGGSGGTSCEVCIQASDCASGFCNRVASTDVDLFLGLTTESQGRCTSPGSQEACNCGIVFLTEDSICFGDCPGAVPAEFCENMSGMPYTAAAPVTPVCPGGEVSLLTDPVCAAFYTCVIEAGCSEVSDYDACLVTAWATIAPETCYPQGQAAAFADVCTTASRDPSNPYPACVL